MLKIFMLDFPYQRVPKSATYARIASKAPAFSFTARGWLEGTLWVKRLGRR